MVHYFIVQIINSFSFFLLKINTKYHEIKSSFFFLLTFYLLIYLLVLQHTIVIFTSLSHNTSYQ